MSRKNPIVIIGAAFLLLLMLPMATCVAQMTSSDDTNDSGKVQTTAAPETRLEAQPLAATAKPATAALSVSVQNVNQWSDGSTPFTQYTVSIINSDTRAVSKWSLALDLPGGMAVSQSWNCNLQLGSGVLTMTPVDFNKAIPVDGKAAEIGVIMSGAGTLAPHTLTATLADGSTVTVDCQSASGAAASTPSGTTADTTPSPTAAALPTETVAAAQKIPALHVDGTQLADSNGQTVQLKGVSTHGLAWYPQYVSEDTFRTLRDDWGANTIRLALYTEEAGGYCSDGDQTALKALIDKGVQAASNLGMYAIIDWHILQDGDPRTHQTEAVAFFDEMSARYAACNNVLYEICNEPQNSPWDTVIKPYAETVLGTIRKNDPDAVVIVGTNNWCQDVDAVIGKQLTDPNTVYACHFYAATHKDDCRQKLTAALNAGVPVFVSECGLCDASGGGNIDTTSANAWFDTLNKQNVSYVAWGLCGKNETASLLSYNCHNCYGWSDSDLSGCGRWFRNAILNGQTTPSVPSTSTAPSTSVTPSAPVTPSTPVAPSTPTVPSNTWCAPSYGHHSSGHHGRHGC